MMLKLNSDNLTQFLTQHGYNPLFQKESNQVYIVMNLSGHEVSLFFGILGEGALLQTVAYIPYTIQEKNINEVSRLLHHLNRELDMPGFGMDETNKLIFYRTVTPTLKQEIDEEILITYINVTRLACETFLQIVGMTLSEKSDFKENLRKSP